jgi:cell division protein FtsZ
MNSTNENLLYNNDKNDNDKIQLRSGSPVAINNTSNEKIKIIPENEIDTNIDELKKIQDKKIIERNKRLQELSVKTKTIEGLEELENIPAYIRRDIRFIEQISSEDTSVSNFSISTNNKGEINNDNSFLNKKVD